MEWVHIIEDIEVADFLNGNELVMTTGIGNINTPDNIMKYAKKLYEKHCSCLIINIGPYIKEVPRVLIDFCNKNNMPLFTVPWEVQLVNMTRWFCEILIENAEKEKSLTSLVKDYLFKPEERSMLYSDLTRHGFSQHLNYCVADFGIVGESGCGKSVTSQSVMRLYDEKRLASYEGEISFDGKQLLQLKENEMEKIRGNEISMIFQDSLSSLNPVFTVGDQIGEALRIHQGLKKEEAMKKAVEMLKLTGIPAPEQRVLNYPHEMSGGMRQRAMIAMALACQPKLLIADEPTTALDVTIQAQIMDLIKNLNKEFNTGIILITHDLGVVAQTCQRVVIMYLGQIVEEGATEDIFKRPLHPYTMGLIKSIPTLATSKDEELFMIKGTVPSLSQVPTGCRFCARCPRATKECQENSPELTTVNEIQTVRCFHAELKD